MNNPMGPNPHLPVDYLERLATTRTGIAAEHSELFSPARPTLSSFPPYLVDLRRIPVGRIT